MTIAFILPRTFTKLSFQAEAIFPAAWKLIIDYKPEPSNFILPDGAEYHVPCNFMIWTREEVNWYPDLRKQKPKPTDDFIFLPRGSKDAIFCINGNSGKVRKVEEITNPKAEHYIGVGTKNEEELLKKFSHFTLTFSSGVSGGNAWVGRNEILTAYNSLKNKEV